MQEETNKQKRMTLKTVHQMLDGMSVELAEKVHLLFMAFFRFPPSPLAKRGSTSPCIPSPQAREKLRISRIPHSQSSGIAREACALKGERCVFMRWISTWKYSTLKPISSVTCTVAPASQTCSVMPKPNTGTILSWGSAPCGGCGRRKGEIKAQRKAVGSGG